MLALQAVAVSSSGGRPVIREADDAPIARSRLRGCNSHCSGTPAADHSRSPAPMGRELATSSVARPRKCGTRRRARSYSPSSATPMRERRRLQPRWDTRATASADKTAKVWDSGTGGLLFNRRPYERTLGYRFRPDGRAWPRSGDRRPRCGTVRRQGNCSLLGATPMP